MTYRREREREREEREREREREKLRFFGSSQESDFKNVHVSHLPCQAPGVMGSVLGLVGPMSVYCDWAR